MEILLDHARPLEQARLANAALGQVALPAAQPIRRTRVVAGLLAVVAMDRLALRPIVSSVGQQGVLRDAARSQQRSDPADLCIHRGQRSVIVGLVLIVARGVAATEGAGPKQVRAA